MTPPRPTTLGSDNVTPNSRCRLPTGITARSSRKNHLCNARRDDADAVLAGVVTFDDGDVGVSNVFFELLAIALSVSPRFFTSGLDRYAADARGGPQKHLRGAVVADHLGLHVGGIDAENAARDGRESACCRETCRR